MTTLNTFRDRLMEADRQREREGIVWRTLRSVVAELDRLGIPSAVVGGLAMQHFGSGRSTQDVDLLIGSPVALGFIHECLVGHGYLRKSPQSRHLRDEVTRVRVEFFIAGEYPGDGRPTPVAFPSPADVAVRSADGIPFVKLETLIELKLASAMTAPQRIKDRADVLDLIHLLQLGPDFAERLHPYVRESFLALAVLPPPSEPDDD